MRVDMKLVNIMGLESKTLPHPKMKLSSHIATFINTVEHLLMGTHNIRLMSS
jgi:hypothetical protein